MINSWSARVSNQFRFILGSHWVDNFLSGVLLSLMVVVLGKAGWVWNPPSLVGFVVAGAILGFWAGKTRWPLVLLFIYILIVGFVLGMQTIAKLVIPGINSFWIWLEYSNWQIFLFLERLQGWLEVVRAGNVMYDQGFWQFLLILGSWLSTAWLVICLQRKNNLTIGLVPLLFVIGYVIHQDHKPIFPFLIALLLGLILLHSREYQQKESLWRVGKIDFPEQLWLDKSAFVLYLSVIVLLVSSLVSLLITREGLQDIRDWVKGITEPGAVELSQSSEGSTTNRPGILGDPSSFLPRVDMTEVGSPLPTTEGLIMRVRVMDSTPRPWRMAIYDQYTGQGWLEAAYDETLSAKIVENTQDARRALLQRFILYQKTDGQLFAAGEPVQAISEGVTIVPLENDESQVLFGPVQRYEVISMVPAINSNFLMGAKGTIPPEILEGYLQLPEGIPERVRVQARRLFADNPTFYEKVIRAQDFVRKVVPYDLNTPPPREGQDVVDYLLFEAPSGFCSYYASAMAVLLRMEGIPTRVVTGYASGVYVFEEGYFEVTGDLAHAWVEVYFPGYGWIPFEPTPSQAIPGYSLTEAAIEDPVVEQLEVFDTKAALLFRQIALIILVIGVLLTMALLFRRLIINRRQEKGFRLYPAELAYHRLRTFLSSVGITSPLHLTPREFLAEASKDLEGYPRMKSALIVSTSLLEKSLYSYHRPEAEELASWQSMYRNAYWERIKLWLAYRKRRVTQYLTTMQWVRNNQSTLLSTKE